ncbi:hypothetical protein PGT21_034029 [Puccinia graminis f. sp. tritici]|uniref:Uncharacterized protein n=1 Tax=Puccinia graminis f. sp. tritici TaxID=56615 RepID=A0A5B0QK31_PUCGR|nr:hypothetical protein PGT21_034029 [Puccinia graminis f. sp. tritici]
MDCVPAAPPMISGILEGEDSRPQTTDTPLMEKWDQLKDALANLEVFLKPEANASEDVHASLSSSLVNYPDEMDNWTKILEAWMIKRVNSLKEAHYGLRKEGLKIFGRYADVETNLANKHPFFKLLM